MTKGTSGRLAGQLVWPMRPRDPHEPHRVASPLELLTDLCVVVAVAQAAAGLHHGVAGGHAGAAVGSYLIAFFAISWAWLTFTWFGSAYDNDDAIYRLLTILQIVGVLVIAAGIEHVFDHEPDFTAPVIGYVIMRVGLVAQWWRASRHDPQRRRTCLRYAIGTALVQVGWIAFLPLSHTHWWLAGFLVLLLAEFAVPIYAERAGITPWHPHHIAERYSLFFIIVLGEVITSSTLAIKAAFDPGGHAQVAVVLMMLSGVLIVFSFWWIYFAHEAAEVLAEDQGTSNTRGFVWGLGHLVIFAAAGAVGAGIGARVEYWENPDEVSGLVTAAAITVPAAVLLLAIWWLQLRPHDRRPVKTGQMVIGAVLIGGATFVPYPELVTGLVLAALVVIGTLTAAQRGKFRSGPD